MQPFSFYLEAQAQTDLLIKIYRKYVKILSSVLDGMPEPYSLRGKGEAEPGRVGLAFRSTGNSSGITYVEQRKKDGKIISAIPIYIAIDSSYSNWHEEEREEKITRILIHEMIHVWIALNDPKESGKGLDHGAKFKSVLNKVNALNLGFEVPLVDEIDRDKLNFESGRTVDLLVVWKNSKPIGYMVKKTGGDEAWSALKSNDSFTDVTRYKTSNQVFAKERPNTLLSFPNKYTDLLKTFKEVK